MIEKKLFIHATNVHVGGGLVLLKELLHVKKFKYQIYAQLDERFDRKYLSPELTSVRLISSSILARLEAELWLSRNVSKNDIVLCFGNLPPLFRCAGHVVAFVQNKYLVTDASLSEFSIKTRLRLTIERAWFSVFSRNVDKYFVQTPAMERLLSNTANSPVFVVPFIQGALNYSRSINSNQLKKSFNQKFLYVASGEPHKMHKSLLDAWILLAREGIFPPLYLTLEKSSFPELCNLIDKFISEFKLSIINLGLIDHAQLLISYQNYDALIFPSAIESFGLPLIEARQAGLPVLAPELEYVRDILDPDETFEAGSPLSIARAVKRFIGVNETTLNLRSPSEFLEFLTKEV